MPYCFGIAEGFPSAAIVLLTKDDSVLSSGTITEEEGSWIVSLIYIGCFFGNISFGYITNRFGRKWPIIFNVIPIAISWLLVLFARNVYYLYASRILLGFFGGGTYTVVPLFLTEISQDHIRGTITASLVLFENLGILSGFILGAFCSFQTTPIVVIVLVLLCGVSFVFFPETALYLVRQNKIEQAEKSIKFYQNLRGNKENDEQVQLEMDKLRRAVNVKKAEEKEPLKLSDFKTKRARKALTIGMSMVSLNQFCGIAIMLVYAGSIFEKAGSSLEPNISAIIVGSIQNVSSISSTYLIDHVGRRLLYFVSTIGSTLGLSALGIYKLLESLDYSIEGVKWIPIASFGLSLFAASLAVLTIHITITSEVLPEKIKDFGLSSCMSLMWVEAFVVCKFLPLLIETMTFHGAMFMFAGFCLVGFAFVYLFVPETKGKSYEEIMRSLD